MEGPLKGVITTLERIYNNHYHLLCIMVYTDDEFSDFTKHV